MSRFLCIYILLLLCLPCFSQQTKEDSHQKSRLSEYAWLPLFEQLCDYDDIEESGIEDMFEQFCELEQTPIDLNKATDDDLQQLFFLSAKQREDLTEYLDRYRPLRSMGELALIESIDPLRKELLNSFCFISETKEKQTFPTLKQIAKYGKNELVAATQVPLYNRKGDTNGYLGYKYKHWLRYTFKYGDYIKVGLTGAQDAGEPFFSNCNKLGYDHYAYYLLLRKLGRFKTIALGQYKLRLGLGLAMNTGFTLGKTATTTMSIPTNSIVANSSRSEAYYLQGAATTIGITKHLDATAFVSYRKVDATLNDDATVKTLLHTGYHRTQSEIKRRHNTTQLVTGGNINWKAHGLQIGATAFYTSFNRTLKPPTTQPYQRYAPRGSRFFNASLYYAYTHYRFSINGETAINGDAALATLNTITFQATNNLQLTAIQRFYSYRYNSFFSASFSDGGHVQNENGVYAALTWQPISKLTITAYTDYTYHSWPRYGVSAPSHSWDNLLQIGFKPNSRWSLSARYRLRLRQTDYKANDNDKTQLADKNEHRVRLTLGYERGVWSTKTQIDAAYIITAPPLSSTIASKGLLTLQNVAVRLGCFTLAANAAYFHTSDYNSRLYAYERTTLYNFSFPTFYGEGIRGALFARANINKNLILIGKIGTTKYFDRTHISSSLQQIDHSYKTDVDLQLKWKF